MDLLSDEDGLEKYEIAIIVVVVIVVMLIAVGVIIYMKLCRPHLHNPDTVIVPGAQITGKSYSVYVIKSKFSPHIYLSGWMM